MTVICPVSAIYLAASQSGQIDFFLFIRIGLKEVEGCPCVMERAHVIALRSCAKSRPGVLGGPEAWRWIVQPLSSAAPGECCHVSICELSPNLTGLNSGYPVVAAPVHNANPSLTLSPFLSFSLPLWYPAQVFVQPGLAFRKTHGKGRRALETLSAALMLTQECSFYQRDSPCLSMSL